MFDEVVIVPIILFFVSLLFFANVKVYGKTDHRGAGRLLPQPIPFLPKER
jgi:hypothetical protein